MGLGKKKEIMSVLLSLTELQTLLNSVLFIVLSRFLQVCKFKLYMLDLWAYVIGSAGKIVEKMIHT